MRDNEMKILETSTLGRDVPVLQLIQMKLGVKDTYQIHLYVSDHHFVLSTYVSRGEINLIYMMLAHHVKSVFEKQGLQAIIDIGSSWNGANESNLAGNGIVKETRFLN